VYNASTVFFTSIRFTITNNFGYSPKNPGQATLKDGGAILGHKFRKLHIQTNDYRNYMNQIDSFHYPPDLFQLMVEVIPLLNRSKVSVLLFFRGAGIQDRLRNTDFGRYFSVNTGTQEFRQHER
jgi:hypothetical protein